MKASQIAMSAAERELGMQSGITRRDFVNTMAAGAGAALLGREAPGLASTFNELAHPWTGYAGVGDYATLNGNTWDVVNAGHGIRDGSMIVWAADWAPVSHQCLNRSAGEI